MIDIFSCEIALRWVLHDLSNDKSVLVQFFFFILHIYIQGRVLHQPLQHHLAGVEGFEKYSLT